VEERLDRIMGIRPVTNQSTIIPAWGFIPKGLRELTFSELQRDVKSKKSLYDDPLADFVFQLEVAATEWALNKSLPSQKVRDYLRDNIWPGNFHGDDIQGKLKFTCQKIKTTSNKILAWRVEWTGPKNDMPQVVNDSDEIMDVFPATAVLFLEGKVTGGGQDQFWEAEQILQTEINVYLEAHPFMLVSSSLGRDMNEDTVHTPVSFIEDTLEIAFNIDTTKTYIYD
jgi:hypothetical protein